MKKDVGQVDILINNAGIVTGKKFLQCSDSMIQKTMEVNIMAHFWVSLEANLKDIFVSPYPTLFYRYGSVSGKLIFLN